MDSDSEGVNQMKAELIGGAIMLGIIGIAFLAGELYKAFAECARDSSEFPEQPEAKAK